MNIDELVRAALHEQATEQAPLGPGFADRALTVRRRRRTRTFGAVAAATAAVVAIAIGVPRLGTGKEGVEQNDRGLASQLDLGDVSAHPEQSPPRDLIAVGDAALAAFYTSHLVTETADNAVHRRTYWLLDQEAGRYEQDTRWSYVDVAPGMRTAAVLEQHLPARRIGLLDLTTGEVRRWIPVDRGVGSVAFSPDGSKLVATTYGKNPDLAFRVPNDANGDGKRNDWDQGWANSTRTGFYVIDMDHPKPSWSAASYTVEDLNARQDFHFSADGKLVFSGLRTAPNQQFYDFEGNKVATPANEKHLLWYSGARLSPNGRLAAGGFAGGVRTTASAINDPVTGKRLYKIHGQELLAWADDKRLIAWDIAPGTSEFRSHLVLVTIGSDKTVPLSGFRKGNDLTAGRWTPLFATR